MKLGYLDYLKVGPQVPFPEAWERLLKEWCSVMNEYASRSGGMNDWTKDRKGDLPYWHKREMTNLGFLAAAAWRLGGVTIQEFEVTRPQEGKGWGDLWIRLDELGCHIEAKGANPTSFSREAVDDLIHQAEAQLTLPEEERANIGIALCFVAPAVKQAFDFRGFVRQFEGDRNLVAVYMPSPDLNTQYEEYDYPGLALIGKVAWSHVQQVTPGFLVKGLKTDQRLTT